MSGRQSFSKLTKDFSPQRRKRVDDIKRELKAEMPLHELRRALAMTQKDMAEKLKVNQPAISKLEHRDDVYLSSLRSYIEAVGGRLKIVAEFPEGEVAITTFTEDDVNTAIGSRSQGGSID
ncbi:MAG: XRE family transcriptional regulator [Chloroflexota bacterium]|nr:XRE family transcriptional regulator [Chloroflexota bacterium]MDE2936238.1 XRE family transcriptional regulator [Chloroflexota bacterium]